MAISSPFSSTTTRRTSAQAEKSGSKWKRPAPITRAISGSGGCNVMIVRNLWAAVLMFSIAAAGQGRRGLVGTTPEQAAAIARLNAASAAQTQRLAEARTELVAAALAQPRDDEAIRAKVEAIRAAELEL